MIVEAKLWGTEYIIENTEDYCGKILNINPGFRSSVHYHKKKNETFFVLSGCVVLRIHETKDRFEDYIIKPYEKYFIKKRTLHSFKALTPSVVIEFSIHHSESDVYRLEASCVDNETN